MTKKHKKHHKSDKETEEKPAPLKLVLKVGAPDQEPPPAEEHEADKKHRHKKKKKKHKHHKEDQEAPKPVVNVSEKGEKRKWEEEIEEVDPVIEEATTSGVDSRSLRQRKSVSDDLTPLQHCLNHLHRTLERKDVNGFFAYPVTDNIAPSYSKIISHPMDMSTMLDKLEANEYKSLVEYRADFSLMCTNCMNYNHPETIYYKEAEKVLKWGIRLMSKEKLVQLKKSWPIFGVVSDRELGIDEETSQENLGATGTPRAIVHKPKKTALSRFEAFPDRLTPEQILAQAQDAAKDASEQLTLRKPNTRFGFLRRRNDGSTSLNLLNPDNDGVVSEKERIVNLGSLIGKLQSGSASLTTFKEDKRNKAVPVNYLSYGPFSSYAPVYDSSQANLSKDESDLLFNSYGDDAGVQYAYSICHFVKDAGDYAVKMVDNLLDVITSGDHSKTKPILDKVEEVERDDSPDSIDVKHEPSDELCEPEPAVPIDFEGLRSLEDLGIDISFVDNMETSIKQEEQLQKLLDCNTKLLKQLQKTQYERLSQTNPALPGPGQVEQQLAEQVTKGLTDLVKQADPACFSSLEGVRDALGVSLTPSLTIAPADTTTNDTDADTDTSLMDVESVVSDIKQEEL